MMVPTTPPMSTTHKAMENVLPAPSHDAREQIPAEVVRPQRMGQAGPQELIRPGHLGGAVGGPHIAHQDEQQHHPREDAARPQKVVGPAFPPAPDDPLLGEPLSPPQIQKARCLTPFCAMHNPSAPSQGHNQKPAGHTPFSVQRTRPAGQTQQVRAAARKTHRASQPHRPTDSPGRASRSGRQPANPTGPHTPHRPTDSPGRANPAGPGGSPQKPEGPHQPFRPAPLAR